MKINAQSLSKDEAVLIEKHANSNVLLICFGGIRMGFGLPVFEFVKLLNKVQVNKIFIRDFNQAWYHRGLRDKTNNITETIQYLNKLIKKYKPEKTIVLGNSSGGYASLIFGPAIKADAVLAISPQTLISSEARLQIGETRWHNEINGMYKNKNEPKYFDLVKVLSKYSRIPNTLVYYSAYDKLDSYYARYLSSIEGVELRGINHSNHSLAKFLRDNGTLEKIIHKLIQREYEK